MKLIRKEVVANQVIEFKFDTKAYVFLVKNLTDSDIFVCFDSFNENTNIKIPKFMSQTITQNVNHSDSSFATDKIYIQTNGEGEVEIQCLAY